MKKLLQFLAILLAAGLLLAAFGCKKPEEPKKEEPTTQEEATLSDEEFVESAAEMIYDFYKPGKDNIISANFKLPSTTKFQGEDVEIKWEVVEGKDYVVIESAEDGKVLVKLTPEAVDGAIVKLKFMVEKGDAKAEKIFEYVLSVISAAEMDAILDAAYALEKDAAMEEPVTLVGVITKINTPYDDSYKNVTVTIVVNGREDKPIMCYRLKGEGADVIKKNDTIKVRGTIKNYNGTIEFDAGCELLEIVEVGEAEPVTVYGSEQEIVDAAYALAGGDSLDSEQTLTGKITKVDTPYDESYQNVSVTIVVEGREDKPILCYRLKGEGADKIKKNDVIKVSGILTNYVDAKSGKSKIEFTAGCKLLEIVEVGEAEPEVTYGSEAEIVAAAYALADGDSLASNQTLTGKITKVKTAYDPGFGNITVIISCQGKEIQCYRMKGTGVETLKVGDTIKVNGLLKNYQGTVEFDAGCQLVEIVAVGAVVNYGTQDQIVDAAYALGANESLVGDQTLTGVITKVNTPYDTQYQNISVTIVVNGKTDKPIYCYRIKGTGADTLKVGDTITVTGLIKNYVGSSGKPTIEFDAGSKLTNVVPGQGGGEAGGDQVDNVTSKTYTVSELLAAMANYEAFQVSKVTCTVTGTVSTSSYNSKYSSYTIWLKSDDGATAQAFELYSVKLADGTEGDFSAANALAGKTVSCTGYVEFFQSANTTAYEMPYLKAENSPTGAEYTPVFTITGNAGEGGGEGGEGGETGSDFTPVKPEAGKTYYMAVDQKKAGKVMYFNGTADASKAYWLLLSENKTDAVVIHAEEASGGLNFYFLDGTGAKKYVTIALNGTYVNAGIVDAAGIPFTYNETYKTIFANVGEKGEYFLGAYNTYANFSASSVSQRLSETSVDVDQFPVRFIEATEGGSQGGEGGEGGEGGGESTGSDFPAVNTPYKLVIHQNNTEVNKVLYFNGEVSSKNANFLATTEIATEAVDVYTEAATGGYNLYFMKDSVKTYIVIAENSNKAKMVLSETAGAPYVYNATFKTGFVTLSNGEYYTGTYSNYDTFSASKTSYMSEANVDVEQFPGRLEKADGSEPTVEPGTEPGGESGEGGEGGGEGTDEKVYTVDEILAVMANYTDKQISEAEYTVTGIVTESSFNSKYGSYTIWLQNNDGTTAKAFELYSVGMTATITDDYSAANALAGKTVTCTGYVELYGTTYEMPYLSEKNSPTGAEVRPTITAIEDPEKVYTVDEILAVMADYTDKQISEAEYTVTGVVTESSFNSKYGSYTIWLQNNDGTTAKAFELYSVGIAATITDDYTAANALAGKTVTCTGYVELYGTTYEMPYLSEKNSPTGAEVRPTITAVEDASQGGEGGEGGQTDETVYTVDGILAVMADYADNAVSETEYTVTGFVTESSYSTKYSSYTLWLASDDGTNTKAFELYSVKLDASITGDYTVANAFAGSTVTCKGYLKKYVKNSDTTYEMAYISATDSSPVILKVEAGEGGSGEGGGEAGGGESGGGATGGTVTITASTLGYSNQTEVTQITSGTVVITLSKGSGSSVPKYYDLGTSVRTYGGNTITFSTTDGSKISGITLTIDSSKTGNASADTGTYSVSGATATWTGTAASTVTLTVASGDQLRMQVIAVTTE